MKIKPVFILSGLSGVGKSTMLEHIRQLDGNALILRSFNKFLLDKFMTSNSVNSLMQDSCMQAYHCSDLLGDKLLDKNLILERSYIDPVFFHRFTNDLDLDIGDKLIYDIGNYTWLLTRNVKPIVIIDIICKDKEFILKSLKESNWRNRLWRNESEYLDTQDKYKSFMYSALNKSGVRYKKIPLIINDISKFTDEAREEFIINYILNYVNKDIFEPQEY